MFGHQQVGTDMRVLSYSENVLFWVRRPELQQMYPHTVFGWLCWMTPFEYAVTRPLVGREN